MENTIINDVIPVNTQASNLDTEVEFVDPVKVFNAEDFQRRKVTAQRKAANVIRKAGSNRGRKYQVMMTLKRLYPDLSLTEFHELYVKMGDKDSIDDNDTLCIADSVEQDYLFGKARKRRKLRKKYKKEGLSKRAARKKARKTVRKQKIIRKKIGGAVRKVGKAVGKVVKRTAGATVLLPLQPFRGTMLKGLRQKGISMSRTAPLVDIATKYYKKVVKGGHFDELPDDWYDTDPMFFEPMETFEADYVAGTTIATIVTAIIAFIKRAKKKKETGSPMTEVEAVAAKGAEDFIKKVEAKTGKDLSKPSPMVEAAKAQLVSDVKVKALDKTTMLIIGVAAAFLIFMLAAKK